MSQRATSELEPLLTPTEVCAALRISRATFYRALDRGDLRAVRLGGREGAGLRVRPSDLAAFLEDRPPALAVGDERAAAGPGPAASAASSGAGSVPTEPEPKEEA